MAGICMRVASAAVMVGMLGVGGGTALAPTAAATDDNLFCYREQAVVPQVEAEATALQAAAQKKGWQWGDQQVQDATDAILSDYPGLLAPITGAVNHLIDPTIGNYNGIGPIDYNPPQFPQFHDDAMALFDAMNKQLTTLQHQDTPTDVLPDAAATLAVTKALDNDCHVGT